MPSRALVLSSCGMRIIYHVGVLDALITRDPEGSTWDHLYGTSGGSLVAAFLAQYAVGQETRALEDMKKIMPQLFGMDIKADFMPFGKAQGLALHGSLYSSSHIRDFVNTYIDPIKIKKSGRHLYIVTVGYSDGSAKVFTEEHDDIRAAIISSCSVPIIFPPNEMRDQNSPTGKNWFGDGGIANYTPIEGALLQPNIGHIDIVVSVGPKENRVIPLTESGSFPSISHIIHTIIESAYHVLTDQLEDTINSVNCVVLLSKCMKEYPSFSKTIAPGCRKSIMDFISKTKRDTVVTHRIIRPRRPVPLVGISLTGASVDLYKIGMEAADIAIHDDVNPKDKVVCVI